MKRSIQTHSCEEKTFRSLHTTLARELRNFALLRGFSIQSADDLVQDAFYKLWKYCKKVPPENARAFLYKVIRNKLINDRKKEQTALAYIEHSDTARVNHEDGQFAMEEKEFKEALLKAIDDLRERPRMIFLMNRIEQKTYVEISEILDISVKTVEKHMHNALKSLRKYLKGKY